MASKTRRALYDYKGNECVYCGSTVQEVVERFGPDVASEFEFNHVNPGKKNTKTYKPLMRRPQLCRAHLDEVDKCVLMCVQCHRRLTLQNGKGTVTAQTTYNGTEYSQTVSGQVLIDHKEKLVAFFPEEPLLLWFCGIRVGRKKERILPASKLNQELSLAQWIKDIETHKKVVLRRVQNNHVFLTIEKVRGHRMQIVYDASVVLPTLQLELITNDQNHFWIRNGKVIWKNGDVNEAGIFSMECDYSDAI